MSRLFENIGTWLSVDETKSERSPQECLEYLDEALAAIKSDTPEELRKQVFELAKLKGYDKKLPWPGTETEFLCRQSDYNVFAKALEVGDDTLTFDRSKISDEQVASLLPYFDSYMLDKDTENLSSSDSKPFIVLIKK